MSSPEMLCKEAMVLQSVLSPDSTAVATSIKKKKTKTSKALLVTKATRTASPDANPLRLDPVEKLAALDSSEESPGVRSTRISSRDDFTAPVKVIADSPLHCPPLYHATAATPLAQPSSIKSIHSTQCRYGMKQVSSKLSHEIHVQDGSSPVLHLSSQQQCSPWFEDYLCHDDEYFSTLSYPSSPHATADNCLAQDPTRSRCCMEQIDSELALETLLVQDGSSPVQHHTSLPHSQQPINELGYDEDESPADVDPLVTLALNKRHLEFYEAVVDRKELHGYSPSDIVREIIQCASLFDSHLQPDLYQMYYDGIGLLQQVMNLMGTSDKQELALEFTTMLASSTYDSKLLQLARNCICLLHPHTSINLDQMEEVCESNCGNVDNHNALPSRTSCAPNEYDAEDEVALEKNEAGIDDPLQDSRKHFNLDDDISQPSHKNHCGETSCHSAEAVEHYHNKELNFQLSSESFNPLVSDSSSCIQCIKLPRLLSSSLIRKISLLHSRQKAMQAFLCAFSTTSSTSAIPFDSDSVSLVVDTGASAAFTYCLHDFTSFTPLRANVRGLGSMAIKGVGTVQYRITTDKGTTELLEIKGAYYVPQLKVRLLSPQQVCRQSTKCCMYEGDDIFFKLRWNGHCKTIRYSKDTNLAMLYTAPGSAFAKKLVAHYSSVASSDLHCYRCAKTVPSYNLQSSNDESSPSDDELISTSHHTNSEKDITLKCSVRHCADCNRVDLSSNDEFDLKLFSTLTDDQRELLHLHECMGHPNFSMLQDLARRGFIPKRLASITPPQCLACHLGKAHKVAREAVEKGYLNITRVATDKQLADILTKPVPLTTLEPLQKEVMGWLSMFKLSSQDCTQEYEILCHYASIH